jgi:WD40 repeat protein
MSGWKPGEDNWAYELLPHPDGRSFFTIRAYEVDAAQRWDTTTGKLLANYPRPSSSPPDIWSLSSASLSADGTRITLFCGLATARSHGVEVWNLDTNASITRTDPIVVPIGEGLLGASPDGSVVARASANGHTLTLQDVRTGSVRATAEPGTTCCGQFSRDGRLYAIADERGTLRVFDAGTLSPLASLRGHTNIVHGMTFSIDGRTLATASIDTTARIWDIAANPPACVVLEHPCAVETVSLSSDASTAATMGSDLAIRVWNARTGERIGLYTDARLVRGAVMAMPDGRTVAGRERDGTVRFWDITADSTVNLRGHTGYINAALLAEKPGIIVSGAWDGWHGQPGCVRFWDARTGDQIAAIGDPGEVAYTIAVSPDGRYAAAGITRTIGPDTPVDERGRCRLLLVDLVNARVVFVALEREDRRSDRTFGTAFDPTGEFLAVGRKGCLEVRRSSTGEIVRRRSEGFEGCIVGCVAWSPDGRTIACFPSLSEGRVIGNEEPSLLLSAATLATEHSIEARSPYCIVFSPDSGRVLAGGRDAGLVRTFDARTGSLLTTFQAHDGLVNGIALSPDGTRLATVGGDEGDIIVWDTTTPPPYERVARFHETGFVSGATWDSTGKLLIGACDKTIRLWDDVPLRERVRAREERTQILSQVEPMVARLFDELHDAAKVAQRVNADATLSPLQRTIAMQHTLKLGLETLRK